MAPKKNVNEKVEAARYAMTRCLVINFRVCSCGFQAHIDSTAWTARHAALPATARAAA
jgi:hypothetical protein